MEQLKKELETLHDYLVAKEKPNKLCGLKLFSLVSETKEYLLVNTEVSNVIKILTSGLAKKSDININGLIINLGEQKCLLMVEKTANDVYLFKYKEEPVVCGRGYSADVVYVDDAVFVNEVTPSENTEEGKKLQPTFAREMNDISYEESEILVGTQSPNKPSTNQEHIVDNPEEEDVDLIKQIDYNEALLDFAKRFYRSINRVRPKFREIDDNVFAVDYNYSRDIFENFQSVVYFNNKLNAIKRRKNLALYQYVNFDDLSFEVDKLKNTLTVKNGKEVLIVYKAIGRQSMSITLSFKGINKLF